LNDVVPVDVAPHPMLTRAVARALRQRVAGEARVMDVGATLRATAAARGAFSPRWRELRRTPEYLVLVDKRDAADHPAAERLTLALDADSPQTFPALLRGSALDWVSRADAPPPEALEALIQQLRAMLGGERFQ